MTLNEEKQWPDIVCGVDIPHVHIVGHQGGIRNINVIAVFGQFTTATNGWGDMIEVSFHAGTHEEQEQQT